MSPECFASWFGYFCGFSVHPFLCLLFLSTIKWTMTTFFTVRTKNVGHKIKEISKEIQAFRQGERKAHTNEKQNKKNNKRLLIHALKRWLTYDSTMIGLKVFWADTLRFMVVLAIVSILHDNNGVRNQSNISSTKSKMISKPSCTSGQLD